MTITDDRPVAPAKPATLSNTWRDRAACRDLDPDKFFAMPTDDAANNAAKAVCAGCPTRRACLREAIESGPSTAGVWGASTEIDRQRAYRRVQHAGLPSTVANRFAAVERLLTEPVSS